MSHDERLAQPTLTLTGEALPDLRIVARETVHLHEDADPARDDWWDIQIPARELAGVRVDRDGRDTPVLILDLPEDHAEALAGASGVAEATDSPQRRYGSRAAWSLVLTQPRRLRTAVLRGVLDDLQRGGAPAATEIPTTAGGCIYFVT